MFPIHQGRQELLCKDGHASDDPGAQGLSSASSSSQLVFSPMTGEPCTLKKVQELFSRLVPVSKHKLLAPEFLLRTFAL